MPDQPDVDPVSIARAMRSIRKRLSLSKKKMAHRMGLKRSEYEHLEHHMKDCRLLHLLAAERISLQDAKLREDKNLLAKSVRQEMASIGARPD